MDIEEVAEKDPKAIARLHVDPLIGFQDFHARRLAYEAGIDTDVIRPVGALLAKLYEAFVEEEAMLVEVNPLIITGERKVVALDAKVTLDDTSLFRHPQNAELRNPSGEDPQERMAKERGLTYVSLDGTSASSATAPAWSCRRSTWSRRRAAPRPTSSMRAAARRPRRSRARSR
jgi:succinyl-CoA synthetase beta subunit